MKFDLLPRQVFTFSLQSYFSSSTLMHFHLDQMSHSPDDLPYPYSRTPTWGQIFSSTSDMMHSSIEIP